MIQTVIVIFVLVVTVLFVVRGVVRTLRGKGGGCGCGCEGCPMKGGECHCDKVSQLPEINVDE